MAKEELAEVNEKLKKLQKDLVRMEELWTGKRDQVVMLPALFKAGSSHTQWFFNSLCEFPFYLLPLDILPVIQPVASKHRKMTGGTESHYMHHCHLLSLSLKADRPTHFILLSHSG